jgi:glycogen(starch) synthase
MKTSIVINTLDRADSLDITLESLKRLVLLETTSFEVIVVNGPSKDHTLKTLDKWHDSIRIETCDVPNLSISRNIGIKAACGEIIAFLDDDSIPEANWLIELEEVYKDPRVGAAGGPVFDHNGFDFQTKYEMIDRFGNPHSTNSPTPFYCYPDSPFIPHLLGANSSFRSAAIRQIGGFDETFEYFLDESDVLLRIQDAGFIIRQLPVSFVHHKSRPSGIRNNQRIPTNRYSIIKNKIYFINKHCKSANETLKKNHIGEFLKKHKNEALWAKKLKLITDEQYNEFIKKQYPEAISKAEELKKIEEKTNVINKNNNSDQYKIFNTNNFKLDTLRVVLVSKALPPDNTGGIARFVLTLSKSLSLFCHVHVITESHKDLEYIEFIEGVWIHYVKASNLNEKYKLNKPNIFPINLFEWSSAAVYETLRIMERMKVDIIEAPIWDAEGVAFFYNKHLFEKVKVITSLHTTLKHYVDSNQYMVLDEWWNKNFYLPVIEAERFQLLSSDAIRANSVAIVSEIEEKYGITFNTNILKVIPHGIEARSQVLLLENNNYIKNKNQVIILFVGRLEPRKGIETLLSAIETIFNSNKKNDVKDKFHQIKFLICGKDNTNKFINSGLTYKETFNSKNISEDWFSQVDFLGEVSDEDLWKYYEKCDIFVAPSKFESFGLIFLEAMSCGKPVIGTNTGGIPEVIKDGINGLLVTPDDPQELASAIQKLILDDNLRIEFGKNSEKVFKENFVSKRMAEQSLTLYNDTIKRNVLRVVVVHSILVKHDGISNIIIDHINKMSENPFISVSFVGYRCDYSNINSRIIKNREEFLRDSLVVSADIIIFHYGIYYEFFDSIVKLSGNKNCYVIFHNITPVSLVDETKKSLIEMSIDQIKYFKFAKKIFAISNENLAVLEGYGLNNIDSNAIGISCNIQHYKEMVCSRIKEKINYKKNDNSEVIRIVFIGRMVFSKGCLDALDAIRLLLNNEIKIELNIISNSVFGDELYRTEAYESIKSLSEKIVINVFESIDDKNKNNILLKSDIFILPSYHEGFGIPFLEALSFGCRVVAYSNSNVSRLLKDFGYLAETGNIGELTSKLYLAVEDWKVSKLNLFHSKYIMSCESMCLNEIDSWNSNFINLLFKSNTNKTNSLYSNNFSILIPSDISLICKYYGYKELKDYNSLMYHTHFMMRNGYVPGTSDWKVKLSEHMNESNHKKYLSIIYKDDYISIKNSNWISNRPMLNYQFDVDDNGHWLDIIWGPYIRLYEGKYRLDVCLIDCSESNVHLLLQATTDDGKKIISRNEFTSHNFDSNLDNHTLTMFFDLPNSLDNVEFKLILVKGVLKFNKISRCLEVA